MCLFSWEHMTSRCTQAIVMALCMACIMCMECQNLTWRVRCTLERVRVLAAQEDETRRSCTA